jgi:hypothetical protein
MTPKEKAEELVLKYLRIKTDKMFNGWWHKKMAKQCAIIAVNEIQNVISLQKTTLSICAYRTLEDFNHDIRYNEMLRHEAILYFDFVKQEIKKL